MFVFQRSHRRWVLEWGGKILVLFGLVLPEALINPVGVWMTSTPEAEKHKIALLRICKTFITETLANFAGVYCWVEEGAPRGWLLKLGFQSVQVEDKYERFELWQPLSPSLPSQQQQARA